MKEMVEWYRKMMEEALERGDDESAQDYFKMANEMEGRSK